MSNASLVPTALHGSLDAAGLNHRPVLLSIDTDIHLDGSPAPLWLIVTPDHLSVVQQDGPLGSEAAVERVIPWNKVEKFRTSSGTGSGLLQAKLEGGWIDVLRYSNRLAGRFHKVSRRLEQLLEERQADAGPAHDGTTGNANSREMDSRVRYDTAHAGADGVVEPIPVWDEQLDPPRCESCQLRLTTVEESCPRCLQKGQILRRVTELMRPHMRGAIFLSVLTIVGVMAELIPPKLQQYMVDHILGPQAAQANNSSFTTALLVVVLALAASRVILSAVGWIKGRVATVIGTGLTSTLREQMVRKLQNIALVYYDRHQVGSTLSRVAHDSEVLHGMMHQITGGFLLQTVQLFGVGAMLVWINPKLALYTLIPVPLVFLGSWIFWQKVYPRHYRLWDASSKQMSALNGMLNGIRVVKAFAQEDREFQRFQTASDHLRKWRLWVDQTNASYSAAMQLVFSLGGLIVWYVGGLDVIGQDMTLGQLIAFLAYLAMFYAPLTALSNFTTWLTSFLSGSKRVLELLDMPLTIAEPNEPIAWDEPRGEIRFNKVSFGYDRNQPVLKDISFDVKPGEMIGIVGRSGSGKSTMVNLLGRFYDVQEGAIEVDGIDLRQMSMQQLRQRIGIVFQESFLFRGTIWKNLSYGRPTTSIEEGLEAARAAGAHDFICRTQLGYETLLGEHGAGLSGGEKQRLSIARTL
ncbi:MAG: ABC transporter ATP-binding protein, partial [Aureliella sp.]